MMKKILACCLLYGLPAGTVKAQLTDSKWKSFLNIPDPVETYLQFKKDTAVVSIAADGSLVETMAYSLSKDTLRLAKISGMSSCSEVTVGLYKVEVKNDKLSIIPISDDCFDRLNAFKPEAWTRERY